MNKPLRDYQEINYPILWGGHLVRPKPWAGETPTPQEKLYVFLFESPFQQHLNEQGCFVVYFPADEQDIDPEDAQYTNILLACTRHLLDALKDIPLLSLSENICHFRILELLYSKR